MVIYTVEQRAARRIVRETRRWQKRLQKKITLEPGGSAHDRRKVRRAATSVEA
jgi:hypothetical protein